MLPAWPWLVQGPPVGNQEGYLAIFTGTVSAKDTVRVPDKTCMPAVSKHTKVCKRLMVHNSMVDTRCDFGPIRTSGQKQASGQKQD